MVFQDIHEFLNDIHGSRENSSMQTNMYSFTFPWILTNCHLASVTLCKACLVNVKKLNDYAHLTSQNQVNHPRRSPLHASLHYTSRNVFCLMIVFLHDWSSHDLGFF